MSITSNNNVTDLTVEACILQLVKLSLKKKASSIAVRFNPKTYKIQVVDNGIGFTKSELTQIFCKNGRSHSNFFTFFYQIKSISDTVMITSRNKSSFHTYVKAVNTDNTQKLFKGYHRPSKGTTVSIYIYSPAKWNNEENKDLSILCLIARFAVAHSMVSFSLRNDEDEKLLLNVKTPRTPWDILKFLKAPKDYEVALLSITQAIQKDNANNTEEHKYSEINLSPVSLLLNSSPKPDFGSEESGIVGSHLSEWSNWSYKPKQSNTEDVITHRDNIFYSFNNNVNDNFINLSQLSVWSDWSYKSKKLYDQNSKVYEIARDPHYRFLPIPIYRQLPYKRYNLLDAKDMIQTSQFSNFEDPYFKALCKKIYFQNSNNIEIYEVKHKIEKCTISKKTINSLQIVKQVNKEFIAAIANENEKRFLILIDQHAVHERIRYEFLIEDYREEGSYKYLSKKLIKDLMIPDINEKSLQLIISHKKALNRVGINIKSVVDSKTCLVDRVPKCFMKRIKSYNNDYNTYRLMRNVKKLLLEVADGLAINVLPPLLPITINNIIASEACHGAIKFGDPLSVKDCTFLVRELQNTKAPTRCAHGRPTLVPLLNLNNLEKIIFPVKKKLNLASLKNQTQKNI